MKKYFLLLTAVLCCSSLFAQRNVCQFSIDEKPTVRVDDHLQGIWKLREDTNYHNYFIVEKLDDYSYCLTYMNYGGDNRGLEHGWAFFSEINNVRFMTLPSGDNRGVIFLKINSIGKGSWDMTANLVISPEIMKVKSRKELRSLLEKNLKNPSFYSKELHFRKKFEFNSCR